LKCICLGSDWGMYKALRSVVGVVCTGEISPGDTENTSLESMSNAFLMLTEGEKWNYLAETQGHFSNGIYDG
jgi:hypothetical protein